MMDLRAVLLSILVFHLGEASYIIKQMRLRRMLVSTTDCDKGSYFDPYLEKNGRCQPCSEICGDEHSQIGDEGACEKHKDQCKVVQEVSTQGPPITSGSPTPATSKLSDTGVIAVAVATVSLAVLTTGILACFIFRNCRRRSNVDTENRTSPRPRLIKPVEPNSLHTSRDRICVNKVNGEPLEAHQMALLQSQHVREFSSLDQNETSHNGIVCREPSVNYDARNVQTDGSDSFRPFV